MHIILTAVYAHRFDRSQGVGAAVSGNEAIASVRLFNSAADCETRTARAARLVGTEAADQLEVLRARRPYHVMPQVLRVLHRAQPHAARRREDEDALRRLGVGRVEGLPGGKGH